MTLNRVQRQTLFDALVSAFDFDELRLLLEYRLDIPNYQIVYPPNVRLDIAVANTIRYFEQREMTGDLVIAAYEFRPRHKQLAKLAQSVAVHVLDSVDVGVERVLSQNVPDFEPVKFRADVEALEPRVCRIELQTTTGDRIGGTGFLIGEDRVLTAGHVMQPAIDFAKRQKADLLADPRGYVFLFDFKLLRDGRTPSVGVEYRLQRDDWLLAYSPVSPRDYETEPKPDPDRRDLDFAVVRLDAPAGNHPIGTSNAAAGGEPRNWVDPSVQAGAPPRDSPLFILHHPDRKPLELAMEMRSIIGFNGNGTRLKHRTNTDHGSSGAPCFDAKWNLVGVHQGTHVAEGNDYNQAVPMGVINEALKAGGTRWN